MSDKKGGDSLSKSGTVVLDWINFDASDLEARGEENGKRLWETPDGDLVSLECYLRPPDITVPLNDSVRLLRMFREGVAKQGVVVVELATLHLDGCAAIRMIAKCVQDADTGRGRLYFAKLMLPTRDLTLAVQVECTERGMTGVREALVTNLLLKSGELRIEEDPGEAALAGGAAPVLGAASMVGWVVDPSDPAPAHLARNIAEDPKYDAIVPDHPLSRLRAHLAWLEPSIALAQEFKALPEFDPAQQRKPWWKLW